MPADPLIADVFGSFRQILAVSLTAQNTFSSLLAEVPFSIPAFQNFWNYVLLFVVYAAITLVKYGPRKYAKLLVKDGWKYLILSFCDVEGNYFTVLAYRCMSLSLSLSPSTLSTHNPYSDTTILSAQLINFWAIVIVVLISTIFLKVRYHWSQLLGILICIGGVGILFGSDHITQHTSFTEGAPDPLKGDLFALLGATFYGCSNIFEEFFLSKRPTYEVLGFMGCFGMLINGAQTGIFDRAAFHSANWHDGPQVAGYLVGFTLCLSLFYTLVPLVLRMASAAFFNISLLTGNFWGVVIGVKVFHLHIHWMYPIAFVCILGGLVVYFVGKSVLGEAVKPWLGGSRQEGGVDGFGTARRRVERGDELVV